MDSKLQTQIKAAPSPSFTPAHTGLLQRKCSNDRCTERHKKRLGLQRSSINQAELSEVPPIVNEVLHSPGHPLDPKTHAFMEPRFGHDFSKVRVHTDTKAVESAGAVNALAYTVGRDVVFDEGQYAPHIQEGRRLIAHELTHVVQQSAGSITQSSQDAALAETEAAHVSDQIIDPRGVVVGITAQVGQVQRQPKPVSKPTSSIDKDAQRIIDATKDAKTTPDIATRAKNSVWNILKTYYSGEASKISDVVYEQDEPGLSTTPVGSGDKLTGKITVGKYFVEHIDSFARRVLQVGHELQHIDQYRGGRMSGEGNQDEREFLAFDWEATQQPKPGTGRLADAMRCDIIDCALGYFNCLSEDKRKAYDSKKTALLKLRDKVNGTSGNPKTDPPDACKRCNPQKKKKSGAGATGALEESGGGEVERRKPGEKTAISQPAPQKISTAQKTESEKKGIEAAISVGVETETKKEEGKTQTEVGGKFSFEVTIPITEKLKVGPITFAKEVGVEASTGLKSSPGPRSPLTNLEAEATLKVISLDFEKIKVPLGLLDVGVSGSALASAEYSLTEEKGTTKIGFGAEAESKFKRTEKSQFFITVKGGVEKTYDKEGTFEFKWSPLTWKTSAAVGIEF